MVRSLDVTSPLVEAKFPANMSCDVYMFGCLLFELFSDAPPFVELTPHQLIFAVGQGKTQSASQLHCTPDIKVTKNPETRINNQFVISQRHCVHFLQFYRTFWRNVGQRRAPPGRILRCWTVSSKTQCLSTGRTPLQSLIKSTGQAWISLRPQVSLDHRCRVLTFRICCVLW